MESLTRILAIIGSACLGLLMVLNFVDVVGTKLLSSSVLGSLDISEELMVFLTILPLAYVVFERGHIRVSLLDQWLSSRFQHYLELLRYLIGFAITGIVTWRSFVYFQFTYKTGQLKHGINIPVWPASFIVVIGFGFLCFTWFVLLVRLLSKKS